MPNDILQITLKGDMLGQMILNRFHFVHVAGSTDVTAVLPAFVTNVVGPLCAGLSDAYTADELLYRIITDPLDPQRSYGVGLPVHGTVGSEPEATFVAATVKWAPGVTHEIGTDTDGKRIRRGGKRIAGITSTNGQNNSLAVAEVARIRAVMETYSAMSDGGWIACIAGFPKPPVPRPKPTDPTLQVPNKYALIEGVTVSNLLGSQVSRKAGHGR